MLKTLRQAIAGFAHGAALARFEAPVEHALVLDHFCRELGAGDARAPFLSGGVCFGRMVPMRLIPFQVVCLLGMDEDAFPARDTGDSVNLLTRELGSGQRRVGDPSRRDADRYLFLQLFVSSGRVLYLSWPGMDPRDNSRREPSALVAELLDAAVDCHATDDEATRQAMREALVVRHALQPFSPAAFGAAHVDEAAFDAGTVDDCVTSAATRAASASMRAGAMPPTRRWRRAPSRCSHPPRCACRRRPTPARTRYRSIACAARCCARMRHTCARGWGCACPRTSRRSTNTSRWARPMRSSITTCAKQYSAPGCRRVRRPTRLRCSAACSRRALLAPGADGHAAIDAVLDEVAPFAMLALEAGFGSSERRLAVDETIGTRVLRGVLDGVHDVGLHRSRRAAPAARGPAREGTPRQPGAAPRARLAGGVAAAIADARAVQGRGRRPAAAGGARAGFAGPGPGRAGFAHRAARTGAGRAAAVPAQERPRAVHRRRRVSRPARARAAMVRRRQRPDRRRTQRRHADGAARPRSLRRWRRGQPRALRQDRARGVRRGRAWRSLRAGELATGEPAAGEPA